MVQYAKKNGRDDDKRVLVFGQSIGAAIGVVVTALEPDVEGLVAEAGFSEYRSIARHATKQSFLTWPLYPIYPLLLNKRFDPIKFIAKISPRPVLLIHGKKDEIVPFRMSEKLWKRANEPKQLLPIENAGHLECRRVGGLTYEKTIVEFFDRAIQK